MLIKIRGRYIFFILVVAIISILNRHKISSFIYSFRPEEIEIITEYGTIIVKKGSILNAVFLLSPVGENEETPWVKTGIKVEKGDAVKITASGRINTAIKRVVAQTVRPEIDEQSWVGPKGLLSTRKPNPILNGAMLLPSTNSANYRFGMLLAAVKDNQKGQITDIIPFNRDDNIIEFDTKTDGELVLAVNDIWLSKDKKDVYVPPWEDDSCEYYLEAAKFDAAFRNEDFGLWSKEKQREEAQKQYQKRLEDWKNIVKNNNWNIWYEDNIGTFSVSINVKPGQID